MTLDEVAERPDQTLSRGRRDARPGPSLEGSACGGDCEVDIRLVAGGDMGDDFLGGRVLDCKCLPATSVDPFAVDQHLMFFRQERGRS